MINLSQGVNTILAYHLRSTLIFLGGCVTSIGLTISFLGGLEEETKFVEWVLDNEMLSTKPRPDLC